MGHKIKFSVILLATILFSSTFVSQSAFSHPTNETWNKTCDRVLVTAEITEVEVLWEDDEDGFNDFLDDNGEVEILYKIWEPYHENPEWYDKKFGEPVVSRLYISDMKGTSEKFMDTYPLANGTIWKYENTRIVAKTSTIPEHQKYQHILCASELEQIAFSLIASERDTVTWFEPDDMDKLLGGTVIEEELRKAVDKKKKNSSYSIGFELLNTVGNEFGFKIKGTLDGVVNPEKLGNEIQYTLLSEAGEEIGWKVAKFAAEKAGTKIAREMMNYAVLEMVEGSILRTAGVVVAEKLATFVTGPIGFVIFIGTAIADIASFIQWLGGGDDYLGGGSWTVDLSKLKTTAVKKSTTYTFPTESPTIAVKHAIETVLPPEDIQRYRIEMEKQGIDADKIFASLNPEGSDEDAVYYRHIGPNQSGLVNVSFKVTVEPKNVCAEVSKQSFSHLPTPASLEVDNYEELDTFHYPVLESTGPLIHFIDSTNDIIIPEWIRQMVKFYAEGDISDQEFAAALEHLIKIGTIKSPRLSIVDDEEEHMQKVMGTQKKVVVPGWIQNNARFFADGAIGASDFIGGVEYMIEEEIISLPKITVQPKPEKQFGLQSQNTETLQKNFESQKWNELTLALLVKIKSAEADLLKEASDDAWNDYSKDKNQEAMTRAVELQEAAKKAMDESLDAVQIHKEAVQSAKEVKNAAVIAGLHVLDLEKAVSEQQNEIENISNLKSLRDIDDAYKTAQKVLDKIDSSLSYSQSILYGHNLINKPQTQNISQLTSQPVSQEPSPQPSSPSISQTPSTFASPQGSSEGDPSDPPTEEIIDHDSKKVHVVEKSTLDSTAKWKFVYSNDEPASGLTPYFLIDDSGPLIPSQTKTDSSGSISYKFDSSYSPGTHSIAVYTFAENNDVFYFDNCDTLQVEVKPEPESVVEYFAVSKKYVAASSPPTMMCLIWEFERQNYLHLPVYTYPFDIEVWGSATSTWDPVKKEYVDSEKEWLPEVAQIYEGTLSYCTDQDTPMDVRLVGFNKYDNTRWVYQGDGDRLSYIPP